MTNVLILTAGYGEGHNAAARGLQAAFDSTGVDAATHDLFHSVGPVYEHSRRLYLGLINNAPSVWSAAYQIVDRWPLIELAAPFFSAIRRRLKELIEHERPEVVISVYPVYAFLLSTLYPAGVRRPFRFYTVVTDSLTVNRVWHRHPSDRFFVPNSQTARVLVKHGVDPEIVAPLGFPVAPQFAQRLERPLPPPPRILYMVNAGRKDAAAIVEQLVAIQGIELSVTVGRDAELGRQIEAIAANAKRDVQIYGWTSRLPELMMTHHLLIGKAGGATVQEAIASRTPMLITQVVPGQEEGNAQLLIENGCGALCTTPDALAMAIDRLFSGNARTWMQWHANIERLGDPDAARRIADATMEENSVASVSLAK